MKRIFFVIFFSMISLFFQINTIHAEANPSIHPFKMEDKMVEGSAQPSEELYVHVKETFYFVKADDKGIFKINLTEKIDRSEVTLYLKDKWGYNSNQVTYTASDIPELPGIPSNDTVTFLGLTKDNEYYLSTSPGATIYATYEGKVFSGKERLHIPKGEATQIKAYAKSSNGVKNETVTILTTSTAKIELKDFDYSNNLLKGKAWPYATLKFQSEEDDIATIQADYRGNFEMMWTPATEIMQKTNLISVESVNIPVSIKNSTVIKSYVPTELTPFYMYQDGALSLTGITFPETQVKIDGLTCTISDSKGRFSCTIPMKNEPVRKISFQLNDKQIGLAYIEAEADISKFPFDLEYPITSESSIFKGTTLPNRTFELKYNGQSIKLISDENGKFSVNIPKSYSGRLSLNLVSENQKLVFLKSWTVKDERQLIKPDMKIINDNLILTNNMLGVGQLNGEIIIEHQNGEIDIEKLTFSNDYWGSNSSTSIVKKIQDGDRYILRIYTAQNDREARFEGILHPIQKLNLNSFKSTDEVIIGTTEPYNEVELKTWAANRYFSDPAYFRGTANSEGKVILKSQQIERNSVIDLASNFEITIKRSQSLDTLTYSQQIIDDSPAKIKANIVRDTDDTIPLEADDFIRKLEVQYYKNDTLVKKYERNDYYTPFFSIYYDEEKHSKRFIDDGVNKILFRATNASGLTSEWKEIKVLSTKIPSLSINEIYYGEKLIDVKTSPNTNIKLDTNKETINLKSDKSGRAIFKLKYPITNKDYELRFLVTSEAGNQGYAYKRPIGYPIEDIRINNSKDKIWFVTKDIHLRLKNYELKINGQNVKLQTTGSNPRSVFKLPKVAKLPLTVEITLKNPDKTVKSYYKKTIKDTYRNKVVSNINTSTKNKMIEGIAQPYHQIDFIDQEKMNLTSVMLFENPKFNVKSQRALKIGQTLTIVSKNPFGEKITTQVKIKDDVAPKTPTVAKITSNSKSVSGKTEGNAQVFISYRNKVYKTKADSKGMYRLPIQAWKYKEQVTVYAKDIAGNKSGIITTIVQR